MTLEKAIEVYSVFAENPREFVEVRNNYIQFVNWFKELQRARTLLKATHDLLETANKSPYVLDTMRIIVHYDEADCDGNCLKEDIENYFDEYGEDGDAE